MRFFLEKITSSGGRVGRLVWWSEHGKSVLETPLCLPYTRAGAIPHVVQSVYPDLVPRPTAAMLTLPSLYELPGTEVLKEYKYGLHNFLNVKDQFLYLSIQDPHCPPRSGFNEEKSTSVWTNGGRMKVSVAGYVKFVKASRPNVFESLCDSVSSQTNKLKRVRKSVDRSLRFLDENLALKQNSQELDECGILGAVVGGDVLEERLRSATETAKRPVDGFVIEGFDLETSHDCFQTILQLTTNVLPQANPRFIHGVYSPVDVFTAVESGVDVFDGACVLTATENGCAFTFPNSPTSRSHSVAAERENCATETTATEFPPAYQIDLNEEKYAMDFGPILRGCECCCCLQHTRAYVHHLLLTREILASTLLMMHNYTHLMKFFASLRDVLRSPLESDYIQFKSLCASPSIQTLDTCATTSLVIS